MPYYIPNLVDKYTCIGNTLSTFNISFSALDTNLYDLSTSTASRFGYLSSTMVSVSGTLKSNVDYLSSTMVSVSGTLKSNINYLSSEMAANSSNLVNQIQTTSSDIVNNLINRYVAQGTLYTPTGGGAITWNRNVQGLNCLLSLSANVTLSNIANLSAGDSGTLVIRQPSTSGNSITSFGNLWTFSAYYSSMNTTLSAKNIISYYYDGIQILGSMTNM